MTENTISSSWCVPMPLPQKKRNRTIRLTHPKEKSPIPIGSRVALLNYTEKGTLKSFSNGTYIIDLDDGISIPAKKGEFVVVESLGLQLAKFNRKCHITPYEFKWSIRQSKIKNWDNFWDNFYEKWPTDTCKPFSSGERGSRTYTFTEYHKTAND